MTDVCVFRLIEDGRLAITAVVHVDDIFAVGQKERCDRLCVDLNRTIPVKNVGDLKWYGGCRYSRDRKRGTLTISQQSFAEELVKKFRVTSVQSVPLKVGVKLEEFDENEETESWPFHELVGGLMWLAISTRPDISNGSSICCEVLFRTKSGPLEISAWYSRIHQRYLWFWYYVPARDYSRYFFRGLCRRRLRQ